MGTSASAAARDASSAPAVRIAARLGYVANGVLHLILGAIIVSIAFGANADSDQSGAFKALAAAPMGFVALWALVAGLWALGAWYVLDGFLQRDRPGSKGTAKKWGRRASLWARAVVYLALGGIAASVALGARPNGEQSTENVSRGVLSLPGGPFLLGAGALVIGGIGVGFVVIGIRRGFRKKVDLPVGAMGRSASTRMPPAASTAPSRRWWVSPTARRSSSASGSGSSPMASSRFCAGSTPASTIRCSSP